MTFTKYQDLFGSLCQEAKTWPRLHSDAKQAHIKIQIVN